MYFIPLYRKNAIDNPIFACTNPNKHKELFRYGYETEGKAFAKKTVALLEKDFKENGAFHEYYHPETGEGVFNKGFTSWNTLVTNMFAYLENREIIEEWRD